MALHLLFEFPATDTLWGQSRPHAANSFLQVFYDDTLGQVRALFHIAPNDPNPIWLTSSEGEWYYTGPRLFEISRYRFCTGTTLTYFELIPNYFPFAFLKTQANAAACQVSTVCDAYILEPLFIRQATAEVPFGSVEIRGTSTAIGLEYAVTNGPDGTIPTPVWQASPVFEALPPGSYIAHLRDSQGCEDEKPFTIEAEPVYGLRYTANYKDVLGETTTINLYKREYTGAVEEVRAADDPVRIKEKGDNEFTVIRGQECKVSLLASYPEQYIELFTSDDREFRVDILKGEVLFWRGWIVPDLYIEPYLAAPYPMEFSATDGLGELKQHPFSDLPPDGLATQWDALVHVLKKINSFLPIKSAVNVYETRQSKAEHNEPMRETVVNLDVYQTKGKVWDCAKVIEAILTPFGATIRQCNGTWQITRVEELKLTLVRREYTWFGQFTGWDYFAPTRRITRPLDANPFFWVTNSQMLELRPGYKQATAHLDFAIRENIIRGGGMKRTAFDNGWNHKFLDGTAIYSVELVDPKEDQYAVVLTSVSTPPAAAYLQTERIWVKQDSYVGMRYVFEYMVRGPAFGSGTINPLFLYTIQLNGKYLQPEVGGNGLIWDAAIYQWQEQVTSLNSWQKTFCAT